MATISETAEKLHSYGESIVLIYALNSSGKTRLSVEYKNLTKASNDGNHAGVYYNSYSEDLFVWDNDEPNQNADIKLTVLTSSLSQFHSFLIEDENRIREKLEKFLPKHNFRLNPYKDIERGIESITFFNEDNPDQPIKISRGEERIFVWCFFLALFEVDGWADEQNAHIFIDDPVSSLDDHNIFITTRTIFDLIKENHLHKNKIIVSTHHIGLFSILATWLKNDEGESGVSNLSRLVVLENKEGDFRLRGTTSGLFLYHLQLIQKLNEAKDNQLFKYHFVLLRQVLENVNSFMGSKKMGRLLAHIGLENVDQKLDELNSLSHQQAFRFQPSEMSQNEEILFRDIFEKLLTTYNFKLS
ncbi:AAA family ATPase [Algoriphagus aestuarii]|nr:AAA family ATPase [Algoriphagus aestuarii]